MSENNSNVWFYPDQEKWTAVALVIHGLNLRPEKMESLIATVNSMGMAALNVSLKGHGKNRDVFLEDRQDSTMETLKQVRHHQWFEETRLAFQEAKKQARESRLSIVLVGFSLGSVLGLELFSVEETPFDRMILLAPPLAIRRKGYFLKILSKFPQLVIKSFSPRAYRANPGTSIAGYLALFQSISNVQQFSTSIDVPTHIFLDPKDELVSPSGVEKYITQRHLSNWEVSAVVKSEIPFTSRWVPHHLIIDERVLGAEAWREMQERILKHLGAASRPPPSL